MGLFNSKSKESTVEVLDSIEKELSAIARERISLVSTQKRVVGCIALLLIAGLLTALIYIYVYNWPHDLKEAIFNLWPLLLFPVFIYFLKYCAQSYYDWCLTSSKDRERELETHRKDILDNVKENESYKMATEILDRYDPVQKRKRQERERRLQEEEERQQQQEHLRLQRENEMLRRRTMAQAQSLARRNSPPPRMPLPTQQPAFATPARSVQSTSAPNQSPMVFARPMTPRVVDAPLLPAERTPVDKIVDYLLGDGPSNRYALICAQCHSHNGMALPADFEFVAFRCPYCQHFNPARKQREAPKQQQDRDPSPTRSVSRSESNVSTARQSPPATDRQDNAEANQEELVPDPK